MAAKFHRRLIAISERAATEPLDPLEEELLASHLERGCEECERAYLGALPTMSPSAELRSRVLASVREPIGELARRRIKEDEA